MNPFEQIKQWVTDNPLKTLVVVMGSPDDADILKQRCGQLRGGKVHFTAYGSMLAGRQFDACMIARDARQGHPARSMSKAANDHDKEWEQILRMRFSRDADTRLQSLESE